MSDPPAPPSNPPLVEAQLARLTALLRGHDGVVAVVLLGSAARGELAAATVAGRLELFSDIELLAVTKGRLPRSERQALGRAVADEARRFRYGSPLFHAEVLFRERRRLGTMPPLVFTFEARRTGRVLWGPDLRGEMTAVAADSLDRRNTHEILMKRLWALAEAVPAAWMAKRGLGDLAGRTLGVSTARNPLDVPTVLLPEAGVLLAGYRRRVDYWADHPELPFRQRLDEAAGGDSAEYLASSLADRAAAQAPAHPRRAHRRAVAVLRSALGWILGVEDAAVATSIVRRSRSVFHEFPISAGEVLGLVRQLPTVIAARGAPWALRWALGPRKGQLTAGLLHLHEALSLHMEGQERAAILALGRADGALAGLDLEGAAPRPDGDFAASWLATRRRLAAGYWRVVRLGQGQAWARTAEALRQGGDEAAW